MSQLCVVNAVIKGHHVYQTEFPIGSIFKCLQEPNNQHSNTAVIVLKGDRVIGHVPEGLCQPFFQLLATKLVDHIDCILQGLPQNAAGGVWKLGGGVELPCKYIIFGPNANKKTVRLEIRKAIAKLQ